MVALAVVLGDELPVRGDVVLDASGPAGGSPKSNRARCSTRSPSWSAQRRRIGVEVEEDEALPRLERDRREPELLEAEVVEVLGVLGPDELPVQVVDPGVVRALEADGLAARLLDDGGAAMAADVVERPELVVAAADDDERLAVELGRK